MEIPGIPKFIIHSVAGFLLLPVCFVVSCEKKNISAPNRFPIAKAGADQTIVLTSCSDFRSIQLDATATSDPDHDVLSYRWDKLYGPSGIVQNRFSSKATVENILPGTSAFQLTVSDEGGHYSMDTVLVSVIGKVTEYDLDITFECDLSFLENFCYCYDLGCPPCSNMTEIRGFGFYPPLGILRVHILEYVKAPPLSDQFISSIRIYSNNLNNLFIEGSLDANFSKIIQQHGGPINGNLSLESGSVEICDSNSIKSLQPLSINGILEPTVKRASLRIAGKVYF